MTAPASGPDRDAWLQAVTKALKGGDPARLTARTADGLAIEPLYASADAVPVHGRGAVRWTAIQAIDIPDPEAANRQALADVENGASGLTLALSGSVAARGHGIAIADAADLDIVLAGVMADAVHLRFETAPFDGRRVAALATGLAARRSLPADALHIDIGLDPVGDMARAGGAPVDPATLMANLAAIAGEVAGSGLGGHPIRADGRVVHEAGGSEAQELAFVVASAVAALRALDASGIAPGRGRALIGATLAVDADVFLSVAKLRALRLLFARMDEACGLEPQPLAVHAETAWRMLTRRDPWVNLLRGTLGCFAGAIGGADSIGVQPFTRALGLPDAFARRLARNTQLVLMEEAHLWRVSDPAAGAGGFEALTDGLCASAWALFQEIEREGGIVRALEAGTFQARVAAVRKARDADIGRRKLPITGVSDYPHLAELPVGTLEAQTRPAPKPIGAFAPLAPQRAAAPFERLRDLADEAALIHGAPPRVFLANLGPVAAFTARATFARSLFEAGGIEAIGNDGFPTLEDLVSAFRASGAALACLCSSDEVYAIAAPETDGTMATLAAQALKDAGAAGIYLAGRPGEGEGALRAAGIDGFAFAGCDALAFLEAAHRSAEREAEETA